MSLDAWASAPADFGNARDQWILDQIKAGNFNYKTTDITLTDAAGNQLVVRVFNDALKVHDVRINVSAKLAQQIADYLHCMLPTAKLVDAIWANRSTTLKPMPRAITSKTQAMIDQSARIDKALGIGAADVPDSIVSTVGKDWVSTNKIVVVEGGIVSPKLNKTTKQPAACNYGWIFDGATFDGKKWEATVSLPGVRLIQGMGTAHDYSHTDYSQNLRLVARQCWLNGVEMDLASLVMDPAYAGLVSTEGALATWRQPGVPDESSDGGGDLPAGGGGDEGGGEGEGDESSGSSDVPTAVKAAGAVGVLAAFFGGLWWMTRGA